MSKNPIFLRFLEFDHIHSLGVFKPLIMNLDTRNLSDVQVKVYTSIFSKSSTLSFDVETMLLGVLRSKSVGFGH